MIAFGCCWRVSIRRGQTTIQTQLDLLGQRPRPPPLMLGHSTNGPVVVHARVTFPHAANLPLSIDTPSGIQPRRDFFWAKQVWVVTGFCHPQDSLCRREDILVSESRAPDHGICSKSSVVREANPGLGVGRAQYGCARLSCLRR